MRWCPWRARRKASPPQPSNTVRAETPPLNDEAPPAPEGDNPPEGEIVDDDEPMPIEEMIRPIAGDGQGPQIQEVSVEIPISGYQGPMSRRAARAFAVGPPPPPPVAPAPRAQGVSPFWIGVVIFGAVVVGLCLGGIAYLFLQNRGAPLLEAPTPAPMAT